MAPNSSVRVYEAPLAYGGTTSLQTFQHLLNSMATDPIILCKQLSSSFFVFNISTDAISDLAFVEMMLQGQSFFEASGDQDAYNYYPASGVLRTVISNFPVADPYIISVGGTNLVTTGSPNWQYSSETVWNQSDGIGSSGGYNSNYPIPGWQQYTSMSNNGGSTTWRNIPDVAMCASNIYVRYDYKNDSTGGGTSAAAPLWAGFIALVNQNLAANGQSTVGFINPIIYSIGNSARYTSDFHDIASGVGNNNIWSRSVSNFSAISGYDLCTGWGSPNGQNLINDLGPSVVWSGNKTVNSTITIPSNGALTILPGTTVTFANGSSLIVNGVLGAVGTSS